MSMRPRTLTGGEWYFPNHDVESNEKHWNILVDRSDTFVKIGIQKYDTVQKNSYNLSHLISDNKQKST